MKECRECRHTVSEQATACPKCGAPYPAQKKWDGWGFEYKTDAIIGDWPLIHISFKFRPNGVPVPAKGIIAIGQFGMGVVNISQFGLGIFSLSQFTIAGYAIAQFGVAYSLIAQIGVYISKGYGAMLYNVMDLLKFF